MNKRSNKYKVLFRLVPRYFLWVILLFSVSLKAQAQEWDWVSSNAQEYISSRSFYDSLGNSYHLVFAEGGDFVIDHSQCCEDTIKETSLTTRRIGWRLVKFNRAGKVEWQSPYKENIGRFETGIVRDEKIYLLFEEYHDNMLFKGDTIYFPDSMKAEQNDRRVCVYEFDHEGNPVELYPLFYGQNTGVSSRTGTFTFDVKGNNFVLGLSYQTASFRNQQYDFGYGIGNKHDGYIITEVSKQGDVKWITNISKLSRSHTYESSAITAFGIYAYEYFYDYKDQEQRLNLLRYNLNGNLVKKTIFGFNDGSQNGSRYFTDVSSSLSGNIYYYGFANHRLSLAGRIGPIFNTRDSVPIVIVVKPDMTVSRMLVLTDSKATTGEIVVTSDGSFWARMWATEIGYIDIEGERYVGETFWAKYTENGRLLEVLPLEGPGHIAKLSEDREGSLYVTVFTYSKKVIEELGFGDLTPSTAGLDDYAYMQLRAKRSRKKMSLKKEYSYCTKDSIEIVSDSSFIRLETQISDSVYLGNTIFPQLSKNGAYEVKIKAFVDSSTYWCFTDTIFYRKPLIADFSTKDSIICAYVPLLFSDESIGKDSADFELYTWIWDFGDGTRDTIISNEGIGNVEHAYTAAGTYTVSLHFSNGYCDSTLVKSEYIRVVDAPQPGFSINNNRGCTPFTLSITDTISLNTTRKEYNFYDGNGWINVSVNQKIFDYTYKDAGTYWVTQRLYGYTGCITQLDSQRIYVNAGFTQHDSLHVLQATYENHPSSEGALVIYAEGREEWRSSREDTREPILISWGVHPTAVKYAVRRNGVEIARIDTPAIWTTDSVDRPRAHNYKIVGIDSCGMMSASGREVNPIYLIGIAEADNSMSVVQFSPYAESLLEMEYELYTEQGGNWQLMTNLSKNTTYLDNDFLDDGVGVPIEKCYLVTTQTGVFSNILCLPYKPTMFIPTGITPNGDGLNDVFRPITFGIEYYEVKVYNTYGQQIAAFDHTTLGWDASEVSIGAYMVTIRAKGSDNLWYTESSTITVLR